MPSNLILLKCQYAPFSCLYTQQRHGVTKRQHRTTVEHSLTLLHNSLPLKFWHESFRIVDISNRLYTIVYHKKCHVEALLKSIVDYSFLKFFSCSYFPNLHPYNTDKLHTGVKNALLLDVV